MYWPEDLKDMSLQELYNLENKLEQEKSDYFSDGDFIYPGDEGYQQILSDLMSVQDEIELKEKLEKNNTKKMENLKSFEEFSINEKWSKDVKVKKTGEHADKTVEELRSELETLKNKSKRYQDKGKKVPQSIIDKEGELKFAIRAKTGWKKKM